MGFWSHVRVCLLYDVSSLICACSSVWPGDTDFPSLDFANGTNIQYSHPIRRALQ